MLCTSSFETVFVAWPVLFLLLLLLSFVFSFIYRRNNNNVFDRNNSTIRNAFVADYFFCFLFRPSFQRLGGHCFDTPLFKVYNQIKYLTNFLTFNAEYIFSEQVR